MIQSSPVKGARGYSRRQRLLGRMLPAGALALVAFGIGVLVGSGHGGDRERVAERFVAAWARGDDAAMHALLTPAARARTPLPAFRAASAGDAATATATRVVPGRTEGAGGGAVRVRVAVQTRV